jgi:hypothetical protein
MQGPDPNQLMNTFVAPTKSDASYIIGNQPGPYVAERSLNIYARLGARIALMGIDARVEVSLAMRSSLWLVSLDANWGSALAIKSIILRRTI